MVRELKLHEDFSREDVHDIFAQNTVFTPQTGTWGLQGIIPIPDRPGDFVFLVTFGMQQGNHVFDEGITVDGVLSWQSQPSQTLKEKRIRAFIAHDELVNTIYLFLRTRKDIDYTYLGRLKYLSHDSAREKPVYFQWQLLDWPIGAPVLKRMGLQLTQTSDGSENTSIQDEPLIEAPVPRRRAKSTTTTEFRTRKIADYSLLDKENRQLGLDGERLVVEQERENLINSGHPDLAKKVRHVSVIEGDGAGYDIESYTPEGTVKHIEVKTTTGDIQTPFFMTANERTFADHHPKTYYLYRVYAFDRDSKSGKVYIVTEPLMEVFDFTSTEFRVSLKE